MSKKVALPSGLLEAARNNLNITWEDAAGDEKLTGILFRGMSYLDDLAGGSLDYSQESLHRALLFDYAMYARAGALADFQANYLPELIKLQTRKEVERYTAERDAAVQ